MQGNAPTVEAIAALFTQRLEIRVPDPDTDLFEAGLLDSLAFVNLLLHLENEFGVSIPFERLDLDQFSSIARIARYIDREAHGDAADCRLIQGCS